MGRAYSTNGILPKLELLQLGEHVTLRHHFASFFDCCCCALTPLPPMAVLASSRRRSCSRAAAWPGEAARGVWGGVGGW